MNIVTHFSVQVGLSLMLGLGLSGSRVLATDNIDPKDDNAQFAWGENIGWLNAEPGGDGGPGVFVEDDGLSGYLWSENTGWISLSCLNNSTCGTTDYRVTNDGAGNLAGYAWSENTGWISFSCENNGSCGTTNYGVTIDVGTGQFSGRAWSENTGWISFRNQSGPVEYGVRTSWPGGGTGPVVCDVNNDLQIDRSDIQLIFAARNTPASGPDDPRDQDGDGTITVLDGRQCVLQCTNPNCAP